MFIIISKQTSSLFLFFFFNDTATTEIYTLSLHDALPIYRIQKGIPTGRHKSGEKGGVPNRTVDRRLQFARDRKSTRLNSSHLVISYAVFCLKKKKKYNPISLTRTASRSYASLRS